MSTINKTKRYTGSDVTVAEVAAEAIPATKPALFSTLMVLFKARVVTLLLFSAVGGAFMGADGWPGLGVLGLTLITGWLAASGASAWNQYIERRSDGTMVRTRHRPLVNGDIANPTWVPWVATGMIVLSVLIALPFSLALAFWLAAGAFIYVVIYTLWLKPRTTLNIVIGGAAGSAAVLAGAAAAGNWAAPGALLLALLVFLWTPSHFWSLAIVYRNDYARSDTPMLPVKTSPKMAAFWVFVHTAATALAALALGLDPALGLIYLIPVGLATADMMWRNVRLLRVPSGKNARSLFIASNMYLTIVLVMACIDVVITAL
ncbi:MAG: heme o synthase [Anaerolineae bacterium]